jgi:hypothetical protein
MWGTYKQKGLEPHVTEVEKDVAVTLPSKGANFFAFILQTVALSVVGYPG